MHYGPWRVTVTDGDTAMNYEVYASTEEEACAEVMAHSDYFVSGPDDEDDRNITVFATRIN